MAIIKYIDGLPAFSTRKEAVTWGKQNLNLNGYHVHHNNGNKIYMAGVNHNSIINAQYQKYLNSLTLETIPQPTTLPSTPPPPESEAANIREIQVENQEENQTNNNQVFRTGGTGGTGGGSGTGGGGYSGGGGGGGY